MPESVAQRLNAARIDQISDANLRALFVSIVADLTAVKASITGLTTKLDNDAGVTDTNYTALWATTLVLSTAA